MSYENSVETTGDSVEEAIAKGLEALGARPGEVIVEVLDEPIPSVFGLEGRPARVRLQKIMVKKSSESVTSVSATPISKPYVESTPIVIPQSPSSYEEMPSYMDIEIDDGEDASVPFLSDTDDVAEADFDEEVAIGKVVLAELLEKLGIRGKVNVKRARPSDQNDSAPWILDLSGGNSSRLVGKRGDTLAALQYITRLITSRELQRRSEVIIDVDGYKGRRARQLHTLALRMAEEAVQRGRIVTMEPMPPHERRIVHLALRGREDVATKSVGEGTGRKVTIVPKASGA